MLDALPEICPRSSSEAGVLPAPQRNALRELIDGSQSKRSARAAGRYVALFDRGRAMSLHLFEHVHGESRDRGQAMVDLKQVYARAGLHLRGRELPDYLPALLEFLSCVRAQEAARCCRTARTSCAASAMHCRLATAATARDLRGDAVARRRARTDAREPIEPGLVDEDLDRSGPTSR